MDTIGASAAGGGAGLLVIIIIVALVVNRKHLGSCSSPNDILDSAKAFAGRVQRNVNTGPQPEQPSNQGTTQWSQDQVQQRQQEAFHGQQQRQPGQQQMQPGQQQMQQRQQQGQQGQQQMQQRQQQIQPGQQQMQEGQQQRQQQEAQQRQQQMPHFNQLQQPQPIQYPQQLQYPQAIGSSSEYPFYTPTLTQPLTNDVFNSEYIHSLAPRLILNARPTHNFARKLGSYTTNDTRITHTGGGILHNIRIFEEV